MMTKCQLPPMGHIGTHASPTQFATEYVIAIHPVLKALAKMGLIQIHFQMLEEWEELKVKMSQTLQNLLLLLTVARLKQKRKLLPTTTINGGRANGAVCQGALYARQDVSLVAGIRADANVLAPGWPQKKEKRRSKTIWFADVHATTTRGKAKDGKEKGSQKATILMPTPTLK